uniref:Ig-like domain-containing protein n=1 Tax=Paramormyrops kingsleyae TaxID=1676925 RepID=A0A3B3R4A5_9TELE
MFCTYLMLCCHKEILYLIPVVGFLLHGSAGPLTARLGGAVLLPCFVDRPLPLEELEVDWKRTDSDTIVHLFQEGQSRPESQGDAYRDRAHFFSQEIPKGNFSLLLEEVRTADAGVYKCVVYTEQDVCHLVLKNEAQTFQCPMDSDLWHLPFLLIYLDGIRKASASSSEHLHHFHILFKQLSSHGLVLNTHKCQFGLTSIDFLGHHIMKEGMFSLPAKTDAVMTFPPACYRQSHAQ